MILALIWHKICDTTPFKRAKDRELREEILSSERVRIPHQTNKPRAKTRKNALKIAKKHKNALKLTVFASVYMFFDCFT